MANQVLLLVLGFVLTTVVGGLLGNYYQRRTWDANRRESERTAAAGVFDDISRAMDERLYRMRVVYWRLKEDDEDPIAKGMDEYRAVLVKWNENLNRNLALTYRYFGHAVWQFLSGVLYEEFAVIGRHLEDRYRHRHDSGSKEDYRTRLYISGRRLQALSNDIYDLNRLLISMIQRGEVGLYLAEGKESAREGLLRRLLRVTRDRADSQEPRLWEREISEGSKNTLVAEWQRKLVRMGFDRVDVDGWFGKATRDATIAFQTANTLKPDGIVGAITHRKIDEAIASATTDH
jgi:hypothetical protein